MNIIFLDVDGVLNSTKWNKDHTANHFMELQPYSLVLISKLAHETDAKIVLTSTWRVSEDAVSNISKQLKNVGCTIFDTIPLMSPYRHEEILSWICNEITTYRENKETRFNQNHVIDNIVIIDDDNDMGILSPYLVQTSYEVGFIESDYQKALNILNKRRDV